MDVQTLSKRKYIYAIHISADKTLHCERYPVIYINQIYVYWRRPGDAHLESSKLYRVKPFFDEALKCEIIDKYYGEAIGYGLYRMVWSIDLEEFKTFRDELYKDAEKKYLQKELDEQIRESEKLFARFLDAKEKANELQLKLEKMEKETEETNGRT